jgi:hypothetical protein
MRRFSFVPLAPLAPLALLTLTLAPLAPTTARAGACAEPRTYSVLLSPPSLVPGGTMVVANIVNANTAATVESFAHPNWQLEIDGKRLAPVVTELAPGLATYAVPRTVKSKGPVTLVDGAGKKVATLTRGTADAAPTAPELTSLTRVEETGCTHHTGGSWPYSWHQLVATLKVVPAHAVAFIVYGDVDGKHVPLAWHPLGGGIVVAGTGTGTGTGAPATELVLFRSAAGECSLPEYGPRAIEGKQTVTVAYVDTAGRLSPESKPIAIAVKPAPAASVGSGGCR